MDNMTIITYGGGDILYNVFNAIAMLINGGGGIVRPIALIVAAIGGVWAITKAFFSSPTAIFSSYLIPLIAIPGILMVPNSKVHIEDVLLDKSYTVDHVPLFLAKFSEMVSTIGYKITEAFEKVMHTTDDPTYLSTGMIFGAETSFDISRYKIANGDLEQNLRRFSKQCILYDLAFGRYSIDELKKTTDLWKFFKERTSKVRMILYKDPKTKKGSYLSCEKALNEMSLLFEEEKNIKRRQI